MAVLSTTTSRTRERDSPVVTTLTGSDIDYNIIIVIVPVRITGLIHSDIRRLDRVMYKYTQIQ